MEKKTITVNIDAEVLKKLKELRSENNKKGFLGETISLATKKYLEEKEEEQAKKRLLELLEKGYNMGKLKIKKREELYDRY